MALAAPPTGWVHVWLVPLYNWLVALRTVVLGVPGAGGANGYKIADPGTAAAIPVTASGLVPFTVGAGAETNTLANPTFLGQELILIADVVGAGSRAVTAASAINQTGNTVMTFGQVKDFIILRGAQVAGALIWRVASNDGVALS